MENLVGIVIGFVLTTVIGGLWATYLQQRSWKAQNEVRMQEEEAARAGTTCQALMSLLDRRLYRMRRLLWAAKSYSSGGAAEMERRQVEYLEVLFAWNDQLNTNLSLVGAYFGDDVRALLEGLYADFARVGSEVEAVVRAARSGNENLDLNAHLEEQFEGRQPDSLNDRVYGFGLILMSRLREGKVGRYAPNKACPVHDDE